LCKKVIAVQLTGYCSRNCASNCQLSQLEQMMSVI
jgi:hypothetical protein